MKLTKLIFSASLAFGLLAGATVPGTASAAGKTTSQLQKEVNSLKSQLKKKDAIIKQKDASIKKRDTTINNYKKKYMLDPVMAQLNYQGLMTSTTYTYGTKSAPSILSYGGLFYAPVQMISSTIGMPYSYNSSNKTVYLGDKPDGQYMMDNSRLVPFYGTRTGPNREINSPMSIGNQVYNKGLQYYSRGDEKFSFNLGGKYTKIQGLLGLDDSDNNSSLKVKFTDEKGNVIYEGELTEGQLGLELELAVSGVKTLHLETYSNYEVLVDFANVTIQ
ncbi:NPCBM/NEW2 domain-containing protein [Peribacillus glennii]|uniref:Glycosyl hydrolase family 98 putative carbohydrate-binding module domain-containing protein n=1 Tax=Peribacillus glennii TaxID=2303991 RepID=A0A372L6Q6_9BACI|nr:NPCBM/NEW2 domain-containing protein [Peribacillus glennii]RFU60779.1 hypothetical protein D0466_20735 [Peribacillus glennii]